MHVQGNGEIYEALCTMAACYVRADMTGICDCLDAYKLTDTLSKATHIGRAQQVLARSCGQCEAAQKSQGMITDVPAALTCSFSMLQHF